jgi:putative heme-binding domain-containing protein
VDGLIAKLRTVHSSELRREVLATLIRLYYREADYTGVWWGITPENAGPYFDAVEWDQSKRIETVVTNALHDADPSTAAFLLAELTRSRVSLQGLPRRPENDPAEKESAIVVQKTDPQNPNQIGNMPQEGVLRRTLEAKGNAAKGKTLFKLQSCSACHTDSDGQALKGPHLVGIGKRYSAAELGESILKPSAKIAQGYETYLFEMANGKTYTGFVVSTSARTLRIREGTGIQRELQSAQIGSREIQKQSIMPEGLVNNLTPEELADLIAYLQSLTGGDEEPAQDRRAEPRPADEKRTAPAPMQLTAQEDHKRMMELLKIKALRRGADGRNPKAPNAANYEESKANPYPKLPDPLVLKNGQKVTTAEMWVKQRRPEILEDFDREVYGRVPRTTPKVQWEAADTKQDKLGDVAVITKKLVGHVDNSSCPQITVDIQLTLTTPADARGPVPVIMEFGFGGRGFGPPPGGRRGPTWQEQVVAKGWATRSSFPTASSRTTGRA